MGHLTDLGECMNNPEVTMHERLLETGFDAIDSTRAESSLDLFDDVRAMTWRLLHPTQ